MALLSTTLSAELKAMTLYSVEADAINAWSDAYKTYMEGATSNAIIIVPAALIPAKTAMVAALTGLATGAATVLQAGILAFWGAIIPATAWPTTTLITPPTLLSGLATSLTTVFTNNKNGSVSKNEAMDAIASVIHTKSLGGMATWPTPIGPQPIL